MAGRHFSVEVRTVVRNLPVIDWLMLDQLVYVRQQQLVGWVVVVVVFIKVGGRLFVRPKKNERVFFRVFSRFFPHPESI